MIMDRPNIRTALLFSLLLSQGLFLFGQSHGESKISSVSLKKRSTSIEGSSSANQLRNDTLAPRINF